jgi:hypothetical protein
MTCPFNMAHDFRHLPENQNEKPPNSTDIKKLPKVFQTIDVNTRWEQGVNHDPRSKEIVRWLAEYDFHYCDDYFCWKTGGDGDNGETLMYELDEYFAAKDKEGKDG